MNTRQTHDPYQALRFRDFRLLLSGSFVNTLGNQMLGLAIGWKLYDRTNSPLVLGLVGLVQVLPVFTLALVSGHVADQYDRKTVVILAQSLLAVATLSLTALSYVHGSLVPIFGCLLLIGIAGSFSGPAARTLPTEVVPESVLENSATWTSSSQQLASVIGPALGGVVIAVFHATTFVYLLSTFTALTLVVLLFFVKGGQATAATLARRKRNMSVRTLVEGIEFLRHSQIQLAAITLDLFAVLLGGATTLLPIFARDILQVGPTGFGWLRAAPSIGAVCMAVYLAHRPPLQRAGPTMFGAVAGFGVATIVFGLSRSFWLSLLMLLLLGALDNISVVIRNTLTLTRTPNEMRGRVAAIYGLFVSTSNQLGGFESGLTAQLFGPVLSVVGGGIGTILVVILAAVAWPELRNLTTLRESTPDATGS